MRQKNILEARNIRAVLLFSMFFGSLFGLKAQDADSDVAQAIAQALAQEPQDSQGAQDFQAAPNFENSESSQDLKDKAKLITGVGFEISRFFLTEEGGEYVDELKDAGFDGGTTYLSIGGRIPFLVAFEIVEPYSLGLGVYISVAYQMLRLEGIIDFTTETRDTSVLYERGEITFSPVFYNELALGESELGLVESMALSLAVGPTFALSFGDKSAVEIDGSGPLAQDNIIDDAFERDDSVQLSLGLLLDLGFQIRFTERVGMGVDTFLKLYFSGQRLATSVDRWSFGQAFMGNFGASVSVLLFL